MAFDQHLLSGEGPASVGDAFKHTTRILGVRMLRDETRGPERHGDASLGRASEQAGKPTLLDLGTGSAFGSKKAGAGYVLVREGISLAKEQTVC